MEPGSKALFSETLLFGLRKQISDGDPDDETNRKSEEEITEISPNDSRLLGKPQFV
jgi:hypothetical protein